MRGWRRRGRRRWRLRPRRLRRGDRWDNACGVQRSISFFHRSPLKPHRGPIACSQMHTSFPTSSDNRKSSWDLAVISILLCLYFSSFYMKRESFSIQLLYYRPISLGSILVYVGQYIHKLQSLNFRSHNIKSISKKIFRLTSMRARQLYVPKRRWV